MPNKTDSQLLCEFAGGSQLAFEELTQRHSALVFGVCERLLGGAADADDAALAVFLALARKARALSAQASVAGWLHHVSCQIAQRARNNSSGSASPVQSDSEWHRLKRVVDAEIDELPEKHRVALILQNIQDCNQEDAARQAGCSSILIAARLERARELLRDRLARRGVVLSVGILAMHLSKHGKAEIVPNGFVTAAAKAARLTFEHKTAASEKVTALVHGVLRQMLFARLRVASAVVITGCIVGAFAADWLAGSKGVAAQTAANSDGWSAPAATVVVQSPPPPSPSQPPPPSAPVEPPVLDVPSTVAVAPALPPAEKPAEVAVAVRIPAKQPVETFKPNPKPRAAIPGLSLAAQPLKRVFGVGETPVLTFVYKNANKNFLALSGAGQSNIRVSIEKLDDEKAAWRFDGNKLFAVREVEATVAPGESCSQKVLLFGRFLSATAAVEALPPGKYRLAARVGFFSPRHALAADAPAYADGEVEGTGEFEVGAERTASLDR